MKNLPFACISVLLFAISIFAQKFEIKQSAELQKTVEDAVNQTVLKFADKNFKPQNIAITVLDLNKSETANFRGDERIYPASVVKMFYLAALHQWFQDGKLKPSAALERAEKDMIIHSYNEPTQYIVDALTDTHNGEELSARDLEKYGKKRDAINRYFQSLGYKNINVNQKTYEESLYGRERQWWNEGKNRNMLTTNAVAQLLAEIALGRAVSKEHSAKMLDLMKREWEGEVKDAEDQTHGFTGIALQESNLKGAKLWSKAGWTSTTRHDAAYIELPNGEKIILAIFTTDFAKERAILPFAAKIIIKKFAEK